MDFVILSNLSLQIKSYFFLLDRHKVIIRSDLSSDQCKFVKLSGC